jgi:hypothetical protein
MTNEATDPIEGTCLNRHIEFKRVRSGQFEQIYEGWIFERGGDLPRMAGVFSHNGQKAWGWCGKTGLPQPR